MPIAVGGYETAEVTDEESTNDYVPLAPLDVRGWRSVSYTIKAATAEIDWTVYGANLEDFSDEVIVQAEAGVAAAAVGSYSTAQAVWGFYRVKVKSAAVDTPGEATIAGIAKA